MPSDRYTKKPVTVEAIQYTGANLREVLDFTGKHPRWGEWFKSFEDYEAHVHSDRGVFKILTLEGTMEALPGDWIIRGVKGEHYPCKPDIFAATYARSDLCASGQQVRAEWLPIKTAPKDGSWFLGTSTAWNNDVVIVGWHFGAWREAAEPEGADYTLTHWMPLPSAPPAALTPAPQPSAATPNAQEAVLVDVRKCQTCQGFGWIKNALNKCPNCAIPPACQQEAVPVAWRCKDYADDWIVYGNKAQAELYQACTGCLMEALYAHPPQPSETVAAVAAKALEELLGFARALEKQSSKGTGGRRGGAIFAKAEAALRALKGDE